MKKRTTVLCLYLLPLPIFFLACTVGSYDLTVQAILSLLVSRIVGMEPWLALPPEAAAVFFDIRLPRVVLAMLVGAAIVTTGATLQALFRNPLVDSYILGLSSGAAFGAGLALAVLPLPVQVSAFVFGAIAVVLTYSAAMRGGVLSPLTLVLAGVMVSAVFTALLALLNLFVDPLTLKGIIYWTMGSLHLASWSKVQTAFPGILLAVSVLYIKRWRLNALSLGDREARSLGINPLREKTVLLAACTLATSTAVAAAGIIGIVGLMVPHMVRMLVGPDHIRLIPLSVTAGAAFLLLVDTFARSAASFEIPVGIITTLLGAPFFIYLLRKTGAGGWQ